MYVCMYVCLCVYIYKYIYIYVVYQALKGKSGGPKEGGLNIGQHEGLNM